LFIFFLQICFHALTQGALGRIHRISSPNNRLSLTTAHEAKEGASIMETTTAEQGGAVTVGMEDVSAVENFIAGVCPYLLGASKDDVVSALHSPDATFKLKKFASDPKNPVLFINLASPDDDDEVDGQVPAASAGT
jgi:hypothetical protein